MTGSTWEQDERTRRLMIEVNALGTINVTIAALGAMRGNAGGHVARIGDAVPQLGLAGVPLVVAQGRRAQRKLLTRERAR